MVDCPQFCMRVKTLAEMQFSVPEAYNSTNRTMIFETTYRRKVPLTM